MRRTAIVRDLAIYCQRLIIISYTHIHLEESDTYLSLPWRSELKLDWMRSTAARLDLYHRFCMPGKIMVAVI